VNTLNRLLEAVKDRRLQIDTEIGHLLAKVKELEAARSEQNRIRDMIEDAIKKEPISVMTVDRDKFMSPVRCGVTQDKERPGDPR